MENQNKSVENIDSAPSAPQDTFRTIGPWIFSLFILGGYGYFIFLLANKATTEGVSDPLWLRLIYLFSSIEAIVFTAVGFIFGREVNRARAMRAEEGAQNERQARRALAQEVLQKLPQKQPNPIDAEKDSEIRSLQESAKQQLYK